MEELAQRGQAPVANIMERNKYWILSMTPRQIDENYRNAFLNADLVEFGRIYSSAVLKMYHSSHLSSEMAYYTLFNIWLTPQFETQFESIAKLVFPAARPNRNELIATIEKYKAVEFKLRSPLKSIFLYFKANEWEIPQELAHFESGSEVNDCVMCQYPMDDLKIAQRLACGNLMHQNCLTEYELRNDSKCPFCSKKHDITPFALMHG
eukprot:NODE_1273_length_1479_cov_0.439130.p1 type:complete len:208 gc:universal NODE_1273_length_1479_cov_0.439130:435-1058(+)